MKVVPSVLLGLMLLTSLVSIAYATPLQPAQNSGDINACVNLKPNNPNYYALGCAGASHHGGNDDPPPPKHCVDGRFGSDSVCCPESISPYSLEVSDIHNNLVC